MHVNETVPVDQLVPADGQLTTGAVLSIMNPVMAGIGVQLPTLSQSWPDDVDALEVAVPAGTEVLQRDAARARRSARDARLRVGAGTGHTLVGGEPGGGGHGRGAHECCSAPWRRPES